MDNKYFKAEDVVGLYLQLEHLHMKIWLDGRWGVDALLGQQTRNHHDLDIVIQQKHVNALAQLLKSQGYYAIERNDTSNWNFVLGDNKGNVIDVYVVIFDNNGNGIYYPADSLLGTGAINDISVRCLTPEYQVKSHIGYELTDKDAKDAIALCDKFNIKLPKQYR